MDKITFSEICQIISKLDREETENNNKHMALNPADKQRQRDHLIINNAYCQVLYALHEAVK